MSISCAESIKIARAGNIFAAGKKKKKNRKKKKKRRKEATGSSLLTIGNSLC